MKHKFIFFPLLMMALIWPNVIYAYDAKILSPSGQWLYYNVANGEATVVFPGSSYVSPSTRWPVPQPSGDLVIPDSIIHNGMRVPVVAIGDHIGGAAELHLSPFHPLFNT